MTAYDFDNSDESYVISDELIYGEGIRGAASWTEIEQMNFLNGFNSTCEEITEQIRQMRGYCISKGEDWGEFNYYYHHFLPGALIVRYIGE